jgi:hypothetical protein
MGHLAHLGRTALRASRAIGAVLAIAACGRSGEVLVDGGPAGDAPCEGLQCKIVDCAATGRPPTSLSGRVMAPNGTLPLYGVTVYVPTSPPGPLPEGVQCGNCAQDLPGGAAAQTITDEHGRFVLADVPVTADLPLVIASGKWRRQVVIPAVSECADTPLAEADTRLPRSSAEGDLPRIAITTGDADALECLVRKLGIADTELSTEGGAGRVHLYNGNGANRFKAGFPGGAGAFAAAPTLWGSPAKLGAYDIALFSCEGAQYPGTKPQAALEAVRDYAGRGGRVFLSHWHNIWVGGDPNSSYGIPEWKTIGTWDYNAPQDRSTTMAEVDQTVAKGAAFATWLQSVGASTTLGRISVSGARYTLKANAPDRSDRRVYVDPALSNGYVSVQNLEFSTPNDLPKEQRCGKVVFSDMHVSSNSSSKASTPFPDGCSAAPLTPQEKALAFILFDISTCVGVIL